MPDLTRQQLCAALSISESTVRRLELAGLPFTPIGIRGKRYDLEECKQWLRANHAALVPARSGHLASDREAAGQKFIEASRKMKLRVVPSE